MIDPRFYEIHNQSAAALAGGLVVLGDPQVALLGVAPASSASAGDLCYLEKAGEQSAAAGLLLHPPGHSAPATARIETRSPRATFARLASRLISRRSHEGDVAIHPAAQLEAGVRTGPGVVIGPGAMIGAGAEIGPNTVIGPGVTIGRRTRIGANCAVSCALIGDDAAIYAGVVIGEAGFGVARDDKGPIDVPHFGRVIIQDRVTIGANSTIDRGMFEDTVIGEDTKIDNLSHVAHQVKIGRGAVIAAYAGISGSTVIGDGVTMGGRVGLGDHRKVGAGAVLAAGSIVLQDVPEGETWGGYPARPLRKFLREVAWLARKAGTRDGGH